LSKSAGSPLAVESVNVAPDLRRLPRSPWNFGDGGPVVIVTQ
jgi:hypothetical protein